MALSDDEQTWSIEEALRAQRALRAGIGLPDERFTVPAFVGMISDEIEQWRAAGRSDAQIVAEIERATNRTVDAADIARFYAAAPARHG